MSETSASISLKYGSYPTVDDNRSVVEKHAINSSGIWSELPIWSSHEYLTILVVESCDVRSILAHSRTEALGQAVPHVKP